MSAPSSPLSVQDRLFAPRAVAEELLAQIRLQQIEDVTVTASAGIAERLPCETLGTLLHRADLALPEAKRRGKDQGVEASDAFVEPDLARLHVRPD